MKRTLTMIAVCLLILAAATDSSSRSCSNGSKKKCGSCCGKNKTPCPKGQSDGGCKSNSPSGVELSLAEGFAFIDDDGPQACPARSSCASCGTTGAGIPDNSQLPHVRLQRVWRSAFRGGLSGSFGTTMYSGYDYSVRLGTQDGSPVVEFRDPNYGTVEMFRKEIVGGKTVFTPISPEDFFTRVDVQATDATTDPGSHLTLVLLGGQRLGFEWTGFVDGGAYTYARLQFVADRNGNRIEFAYGEPATNATRDAFKWETATDPYGRSLGFKYVSWQGKNVISEVALPGGRKVTYHYHQPTNSQFAHRVEYGDGIESTWTFDRATKTGVRNEALLGADHLHQTIQESLTVIGRIRSILRGDGTTLYSRTDVGGSKGTFISTIYHDGETFEYVSSPSKPLISERQQDTDGTFEKLTRYEADAHRPVKDVAVPDGRVWDAERDDTNDQLSSRTYPDGSTESFTYNKFAQMTSHTHRSGADETWAYDAFGNLRTHTQAAGDAAEATERWKYNAQGQVINYRDFNDRITSYAYYQPGETGGAPGDLKSRTLPASTGQPAGTITYTYDDAGRVASITDPAGRKVEFDYDAASRLIKTTYGDNSTEEMNYGTGEFSARLLSKKDRNGNPTLYTYDGAGRVLTESVHETVGGTILSTMTNTWDGPTGRLTAVDRDGDSTEYTYDYKGRVLTTTVHPLGGTDLVTTNEYERFMENGEIVDLNRLKSTTDPYGRTTFFLYDTMDHVTRKVRETVPNAIADDSNTALQALARNSVPNAPYLIEDYTYDAQERRTEYTDGRGILYKYEYDARDRRTEEISAFGTPAQATETYTYDGNNNLLTVTDKNGHLWAKTYTARDQVRFDANPLGQTTKYTYYADGLRAAMTNPNGHKTTYVYDTCCGTESGGRLIQVIDADGNSIHYKYDANGNRTEATDQSGRVTAYQYDGLNRPVKTIADPSGLKLQTTIEYAETPNAAGRSMTVNNPAGQTVVTAYDGIGRMSSVTGNTPHMTYTYDVLDASTEFHLKTTVTDANNNSRRTFTDGAGRTVKTTDGLDHSTSMFYDNNNNLALVADRDARNTKYEYDERNRRTKMVADESGIGAATQYDYDPVGNLVSIKDAEDKVTTYTYDDADRRLKAKYASGTSEARTWEYQYHPLGQLARLVKPNGVVISYSYDRLERLSQRLYQQQQTPPALPVSLGKDVFTYHANGLLSKAVGGLYKTTIDRSNLATDYDAANRLLREQQNIGVGAKTVAYTYEPDDLVKQTTYPGGTTVQQTYTGRRELEDVQIGGATQAHHTYDAGGRRASRSYVPSGRTTNWTYDSDDRVTKLNHVGVQEWDYRYTGEGDAAVQDDRTTVSKGEAYAYDGMHRLIDYKRGEVVGNTVPTPPPPAFLQGWTLDKVGNWTAWNNNGCNETRAHNNHHALINRSGCVNFTQAYDGNLNQTSDGASSFTLVYDANDRLKKVTQPIIGGSVSVAEYRYDALGRRVEKLIAGSPSTVMRYYYSDDRIVEERDGTDAVTATYTYGDYIDEPLTMDRSGQHFFYHHNRMYSTYALTDAAGNIVERYVYKPYGEVTTFDAAYQNPLFASRVGNQFTFTGRELDAETGLMHYRARTYDTVQGRFKQRDPLEYVDGVNLYEYVRSNPLNGTDPFGFITCDKVCCYKGCTRYIDESWDCTCQWRSGALAVLLPKLGPVGKAAAFITWHGVCNCTVTSTGEIVEACYKSRWDRFWAQNSCKDGTTNCSKTTRQETRQEIRVQYFSPPAKLSFTELKISGSCDCP